MEICTYYAGNLLRYVALSVYMLGADTCKRYKLGSTLVGCNDIVKTPLRLLVTQCIGGLI